MSAYFNLKQSVWVATKTHMRGLWASLAASIWAAPVDFQQHGADWMGQCVPKGGKLLSPIDLSIEGDPRDGHFHIGYVPIDAMILENDGSKLSFKVNSTSTLTLGGTGSSHEARRYVLERVDVHGASEHTFHGKRRPLEFQLVHTSEGAAPLILSLFYDCAGCKVVASVDNAEELNVATSFLDPRYADEANAEIEEVKALATTHLNLRSHRVAKRLSGDESFATLLDALKESPEIGMDASVTFAPPIDFNALIGKSAFYQYAGSLTLPPCRDATWLVQRKPLMAAANSDIQAVFTNLKKLSDGYGNYRTVQATYFRPILLLSPVQDDRGMLPSSLTDDQGYWTPTAHTLERESKDVDVAKDAITIAKAASDYAKGLDVRLQNAAREHAAVWEEEEPPLPPLIPAVTPAEQARNVAQETQQMARRLMKRMAKASEAHAHGLTFQKIPKPVVAPLPPPTENQLSAKDLEKLLVAYGKKEVKDAVSRIQPEIKALGGAYLRQNLLKQVPGVTVPP